MRLPRDVGGRELIRKLERMGYVVTRQTGSHVRLTCSLPTQGHITVPVHDALRIGTLAKIIDDVAAQQMMVREALIEKLFQ